MAWAAAIWGRAAHARATSAGAARRAVFNTGISTDRKRSVPLESQRRRDGVQIVGGGPRAEAAEPPTLGGARAGGSASTATTTRAGTINVAIGVARNGAGWPIAWHSGQIAQSGDWCLTGPGPWSPPDSLWQIDVATRRSRLPACAANGTMAATAICIASAMIARSTLGRPSERGRGNEITQDVTPIDVAWNAGKATIVAFPLPSSVPQGGSPSA